MKTSKVVVGVLAFQGDFAEHIDVLRTLKVDAIEVRTLSDLKKVDGLIIPGGESTVMAKFLEETKMRQEIVQRITPKKGSGRLARGGRSLCIYGTCAGAILLATKVTGKNAPKPLGLIDITVDRNAYGSQLDSFEKKIQVKGIKKPIQVSFIRAPKITKVGKDVEVLSWLKEEPILVRQGNVLAGTFHPEVQSNAEIHRYFLSLFSRK